MGASSPRRQGTGESGHKALFLCTHAREAGLGQCPCYRVPGRQETAALGSSQVSSQPRGWEHGEAPEPRQEQPSGIGAPSVSFHIPRGPVQPPASLQAQLLPETAEGVVTAVVIWRCSLTGDGGDWEVVPQLESSW